MNNDQYDRMNPTIQELTKRLEEYVKKDYGTEAYPLSQAEANLLLYGKYSITVKDPGHFPGDSFEYEMTPQELLEQGICPCGSEDYKGCSVAGCLLYYYRELRDKNE